MPEKELLIQSFQYGLDTRRSELTSKPGSLVQCENGHINQGAQIEKRKEFARLPLPANTFGIDGTLSGLVVYGSVAAPSGLAAWPSFNTTWGGSGNTVPLSYLRLQAPSAFDASAMTAVIWSTLFGGLPFVIASFASGNVYVFQATATGYVVVTDFYSGLVLSGYTFAADQAANLAALVNQTTSYTATVTGSTVTITGTNGAAYTAAETQASAAGVVSLSQITTASAGTSGVNAIGSLTIFAGSSGTGATPAQVSAIGVGPAAQDQFNFNNIMAAAVSFTTDAPTTAGLVAASVNSNAGLNGGFSATANGGTITIYAPIGSSYNGWIIYAQTTVATNLDGAICLENCQYDFFPPPGSPTLTITNIQDSSGSPIVLTSTSRALSSFSSLEALLAQVAKDINTTFSGSNPTPGTQPYIAVQSGNSLFISRWYDAPASNIFGGVGPIVMTYSASAGWNISGSGGLQASAYPKYLTGSGVNTATTNTVTVTPAGGTSPYSYLWTITNVSGSPVPFPSAGIIIQNPTSAVTNFSVTFVPSISLTLTLGGASGYENINATAVCTITDASGNTFSLKVGLYFGITITPTATT